MTDPDPLWESITSPRHAAGQLEELLLTYRRRWRPGTLAAELARALASERRFREPVPAPAPLRLENLHHLPKTSRIDGILPLTIPSPDHIGPAVAELVQEADRLALGPAPDDDTELTLALLALLHRRSLITNSDLAIELCLACPADHLLLLGHLPLGGRATVALTSVDARLHCAFEPDDIVFLDRLTLQRAADGHLQLAIPEQADAPG